MRKDVKLGLAVGGVLLAVLVVYVLVVPGNNATQEAVILDTPDGSESQTGGATAGSDAVADGGPAGSGSNSETQAADNAKQDAEPSTGGDGATADAGSTNTANASESSERANGQTAGGGWNWDALVNGTERVPSLAAGTDVPLNGGAGLNPRTANGTSAESGTSLNGGATAGINAPPAERNPVAGTAGTANESPVKAAEAEPTQAAARQNVLAGGERTIAEPAPAPTTPASTGGGRTHTVKAGDTYSKISLAAYGTSKHYAQIELANPGVDPTRLKPGQAINLPAIAAKPAAASASVGAQAAVDPQKEYKVQPNDSLYTISLRLYGKADRVEKLYEMNKAAIGDDSSRVKVGMVLKLPEAPTQSTAAASR